MGAFCLKDEVFGYKPCIRAHHRHLLEQFNQWLVGNGWRLEDINEALVECFMLEAAFHRRSGARPTLRRFLDMLREAGAIEPAARVEPHCPIEVLVREYMRFLARERALATQTCLCRAGHAREFLRSRFDTGPVRLSQMRAQDVIGFVRHSICAVSRAYALAKAISLRCFLRFARHRGYIESDLAASVPRVAGWKLAGLPKLLARGGVQRVLKCCDFKSAIGMRDYAILLLLARLGLRAGEVVAMRLEDIDWARAQLTVRSEKGGVWSRMPLCREVGRALARYLKHARPKCASRHVFVRIGRAPLREFSRHSAIGAIVRRALKRAGVNSPRKGAHVFRHTLASDLLQKGSSLEQIGRILRHKDPDTTAVYAKVDLMALRAVAMPWTGGDL